MGGDGGGGVLNLTVTFSFCKVSDSFMLHYSFLHNVSNSCMQEHCKYLDTVAWNTLLNVTTPKYSKLVERIGPSSLTSAKINYHG